MPRIKLFHVNRRNWCHARCQTSSSQTHSYP